MPMEPEYMVYVPNCCSCIICCDLSGVGNNYCCCGSICFAPKVILAKSPLNEAARQEEKAKEKENEGKAPVEQNSSGAV